METESKSKSYWAVVAICILWGTTWLPSKIGVRYIPPLQLSGIRQLIAGSVFLTYFLFKGHRIPGRKELFRLLIQGFFFLAISNGLTTWAMKYISSGVGAIMGSIVPLCIALLGIFFKGTGKLTSLTKLGLILGFAGIILVFFPDISLLFDENNIDQSFGKGLLLSLIAAFGWSFGTLINANDNSKLDPFYALGWQMFLAGIIILLTSYSFEQTVPLNEINHVVWLILAYQVVFGSVLAFLAYIYALKRLPAAQVSIYAYINPIIAVLLGWVLVNEPVNIYLAIGGVITLVGVYMVNRGFRK
ncbi:MAG TPA: EamA family transporter [Parasegetibacter sp.]